MIGRMIPRIFNRSRHMSAPFEVVRPITFPYQHMPWSTERIVHPEPPHIRKAAVLALQSAWTNARASDEFGKSTRVPHPALTKNNLVIVHGYELRQAAADHPPKTMQRLGKELLSIARATDRQIPKGDKQEAPIGNIPVARVALRETNTGHLLTLEPPFPGGRSSKSETFERLQDQRQASLRAISELTGWEPDKITTPDIGIPFAHFPEGVPSALCEDIAVDVQVSLLRTAVRIENPELSNLAIGMTTLQYL